MNTRWMLFLDGPNEQLEFCMDGVAARCGPRFEGFKQLPPGVHLVSYRLVAPSEGALTGIFLWIPSDQPPHEDSLVTVFSWRDATEQYYVSEGDRPSPARESVSERILSYPHLAAHASFMAQDQERATQWRQLTTHVTEQTLRRLFVDAMLTANTYTVTPMMSRHGDSPTVQFTPIPVLRELQASGQFATPAELTACAHDRTPLLRMMLQDTPWDELLGELETSFLLLILVHNFEGFEQWIALIVLFCSSHEFARQHESECEALLVVLATQLEACPDDFFVQLVGAAQESRLFRCFRDLARTLTDAFGQSRSLAQFCEVVERQLGWRIDAALNDGISDDGDDAPVIVEAALDDDAPVIVETSLDDDAPVSVEAALEDETGHAAKQ